MGFGHEICLKIVDEVKKATGRADLKVQLQAVTSANRIPLLQNGTIDIECGSTTGTTNFQILRNLNEEKKLGMDDILLYGLRASRSRPRAST